MKKKKIFIALACIGIVLISLFIIVNKNLRESNLDNSTYVSGMLASYKYYDRDIRLDYFYKLNNMSTYEQIVADLGEPNGQFGSGMIYKYYEIDNGLYVSILFSGNDDIMYDKVTLIRLCTEKEILDIIYPNN